MVDALFIGQKKSFSRRIAQLLKAMSQSTPLTKLLLSLPLQRRAFLCPA